MRQALIGAACVFLASVPAAAQWLPPIHYPQQNAVVMHMDLPAEATAPTTEYQPLLGAWVGQEGLYFAGWAFNCNGSTPVISLWRWDTDLGRAVQVPAVVTTGIARPDVHAAFASWPCAVSAFSGWHLYPVEPLPRGTHFVYVLGYAEGGTFVPGSGAIQPASGYAQRFIVVQ